MRHYVLALGCLSLLLVAACDDPDAVQPIGPDAGLAPDGTAGPAPSFDAAPDEPTNPEQDEEPGLDLACSLDELAPVFECALAKCVDLGDLGDLGGFGGLEDLGSLGDLGNGGGLPELPDLEDLGDIDASELALCVSTSCFAEILGVSPDCAACVLSGLSGDLESIGSACTGDSDLGGFGGDEGNLPGLPGFPGLP